MIKHVLSFLLLSMSLLLISCSETSTEQSPEYTNYNIGYRPGQQGAYYYSNYPIKTNTHSRFQ